MRYILVAIAVIGGAIALVIGAVVVLMVLAWLIGGTFAVWT